MLDVHRIVIKRLFMAWLALSIVAGTSLYFYELEKIDDAIVALAAAEAKRFAPDGIDTRNMTPDDLEVLRLKALDFIRQHFVVLEAYDKNEKKLFEVVNPTFEAIEKELGKYTHRFPKDGQYHYEKFKIAGETLVQILVPLKNKLGLELLVEQL